MVPRRVAATTTPPCYTRTSPQHAAPILTTIGYINWWEGRGSKAHQYMQLALDTDPGYRFARLTDQCSEPGSSQAETPTKTPPTKPDSTCHKTSLPSLSSLTERRLSAF
ncbi:DUF4192 family protein [Paenarthrobacter sp. NPDC091669]|uniref:DUF4192 family protein n=1 Tax=Paenarthrobacter sp. NPDC091669 TaxID=3364384 RepID=UPI00382991B2